MMGLLVLVLVGVCLLLVLIVDTSFFCFVFKLIFRCFNPINSSLFLIFFFFLENRFK